MILKDKILITSGYNFEGYHIVDYLGICSGECALGTGFLSSLGAGFADFLGTKSTLYSGKLKEAKDYAMNQLIEQAKSVNGNAIIGLDIDYTTFSADIMGVIASGTVVKIQKVNSPENSKLIPIKATNKNLPFRATSISVKDLSDKPSISIDIYCPIKDNILGIIADVRLNTIFNDSYQINYVDFIGFAEAKKNHLVGDSVSLDIPNAILRSASSADVVVRKYIINDNIIELDVSETNTAFEDISVQDEENDFSIDDFIYNVESFDSAIEISKFIREYLDANPGILDPTIMEEVEKIAYIERLYGNRKETCIDKIRGFLQNK